MSKINVVLTPNIARILTDMGEQIKLARLRRGFSASLIAERANVSRPTLGKIEKGDPSVSMGAYAKALQAIGGLQNDLLLIAKDDIFGRTIQDLNIKISKRGHSKWKTK